MRQGSFYHLTNWCSHLSARPAKPSFSAEILAASEAIDEGKFAVNTYNLFLGCGKEFALVLDSKDLFISLSTCWISVGRSIRADMQMNR